MAYMVVWNSAKNPPKADYEKFLVLVRAYGGEGFYHKIASYAHDLYKVDKYDMIFTARKARAVGMITIQSGDIVRLTVLSFGWNYPSRRRS